MQMDVIITFGGLCINLRGCNDIRYVLLWQYFDSNAMQSSEFYDSISVDEFVENIGMVGCPEMATLNWK